MTEKVKEGARDVKEVGKGMWEKGGDWVFGEKKWDAKGKGQGYDSDSWGAYGYGSYDGRWSDEDAYGGGGGDWASYDGKGEWDGDYYY